MSFPSSRIIVGDALETLRTLPDESVQCCVTSPPYWGLRDYGVPGQMGLETTPDEYIAKMVEVFREVRRVLRSDGTLWLNIGDGYASNIKGENSNGEGASTLTSGARAHVRAAYNDGRGRIGIRVKHGLKPKDLVGQPWMLAFALRADGWWLRSDIIWHKPNPMPESVTDRPTKSHEYVFLLSKSARYFYDAEAIAEPLQTDPEALRQRVLAAQQAAILDKTPDDVAKIDRYAATTEAYAPTNRNARTVWTIATSPFPDAHFATFPPELPRRCILAGSKAGDTVLDPFAGAGTTGLVASRLGRSFIGIELNPKYAEMARQRIKDDAPMFYDDEPFVDNRPIDQEELPL